MTRILITGSADGLGALAARQLIQRGHAVILHARNSQRAEAARQACPGAEAVLIGDLSSIAGTKKLAADAKAFARSSSPPSTNTNTTATSNTTTTTSATNTTISRPINCIIHNAGLYNVKLERSPDEHKIPTLTAVNTIAPYLLTCLMDRPERLVFVSSSHHLDGDPSLSDITWQERRDGTWDFLRAYKDSKLHDVLLAKAFARRWGGKSTRDPGDGDGDGGGGDIVAGVRSNALDPGWVPTKMGGPQAPGSLDAAVETYVMLAEGSGGGGGSSSSKGGKGGQATGKLFGPGGLERSPKLEADDVATQDRLLEILERITGVKVPD